MMGPCLQKWTNNAWIGEVYEGANRSSSTRYFTIAKFDQKDEAMYLALSDGKRAWMGQFGENDLARNSTQSAIHVSGGRIKRLRMAFNGASEGGGRVVVARTSRKEVELRVLSKWAGSQIELMVGVATVTEWDAGSKAFLEEMLKMLEKDENRVESHERTRHFKEKECKELEATVSDLEKNLQSSKVALLTMCVETVNAFKNSALMDL